MPDDVKADEGSFQLEKLPYNYDALVSNIAALTIWKCIIPNII